MSEDEDGYTCPRCGQPMDEFAATVWDMCEQCCVLDEQEKKREEAENEAARRNEEKLDGKRDGGQD